jgi:hypothetical protein
MSAAFAKQTQPDQKRQREIRQALVAHGYAPGRNWTETRNILKDIAREHHWQVKYAPDARVLNILDLKSATAGIGEPWVSAESKLE